MTLVSPRRKLIGLMGWLVLCFAVSAVGAIASAGATAFYKGLSQPIWAPPPWVFGPVWTALYALMGIAAWLVWREGGFGAQRRALLVFLAQLGVNALWSWLFFAWHWGAWALADIGLMWLLIVGTIALFWRVSRLAAWLLAPYLVWVSFAAALNFSLWRLNSQLLG